MSSSWKATSNDNETIEIPCARKKFIQDNIENSSFLEKTYQVYLAVGHPVIDHIVVEF